MATTAPPQGVVEAEDHRVPMMPSNRLKFQDRPSFRGMRGWGADSTGSTHTFAIIEAPSGGYVASVRPRGSNPLTLDGLEHLGESLIKPLPTFAAAKDACEMRNDEIRAKMN